MPKHDRAAADPLEALLREPLLTPADAAPLLNVTPGAVRQRVRSGRLPALRVGAVIRLHPAHVRGPAVCAG